MFLSPCAPRVGDRYAVQYWECEVYKVVWSYVRVDGSPIVDVYVDMSETKLAAPSNRLTPATATANGAE